MHSKKLLISIVSHGQGSLIRKLLHDLNTHLINSEYNVNVVVTLNIPEEEQFLSGFNNLSIKVIRNSIQKGFGENNNYAFYCFESDFFLVLNPDVRINVNLIDPMISSFSINVGVMAPRVLSAAGTIEDSFRKFPTICNLIKRKLMSTRELDYFISELNLYEVDWVGGMFMLFHSPKYRNVNGFDEKYFMYLEDADICKRLLGIGFSVIYNPSYEIVHDARRNSRIKVKYLLWHLRSMARFLFKNYI
jgi:GT2 family glycosyltransferase|tara:strand:+ start:4024 stop:4764 length:741 start_codon:yes stop_codon:yes gene_type:complete